MAEHGGGGVLRELIAVFGFGIETKDLDAGENKLEEFMSSVKRLAAGIAGAFVAHEIFEFAENTVHAMSEIEHASQRLGISTDRVQEFQFAAKELGLDADALTRSMGRLQVTQQAAASGSAQSASAFSALGVSVKDSNGQFKSADELMLDVADGIAKQKDASKQAALATQLFGRSGRELLPFLKEGRKGAEELTAEFRALGGGYSDKAIEKSKAFEKQSARLNLAFTSLKSTVAAALLPVLTRIVGGVTSAVAWFRKLSENSNIVKAVLITLGAAASVFAIQMIVAFSPLLLMAAAIGAVVLAVDDVITLFEGGESVIGEAVDSLFGKGTSANAIIGIKDTWHEIMEIVRDVRDFMKEISDYSETLQAGFDAFVGGATGNVLVQQDAQRRLDRESLRHAPAIARGEGVPSMLARPSMPDWSMLARPELSGGGVNVTVNAPPGMDEKQLGEHVGREVHKVLKQDRREAAATFQRGTATE